LGNDREQYHVKRFDNYKAIRVATSNIPKPEFRRVSLEIVQI